jgi:hypothetical protein
MVMTTARSLGLPAWGAFVLAVATAPPQAGHAQSWSLSSSPTLIIGAAGDTMAEFTPIAAVARLKSGEISVTTARPPEIRLFSPAGSFVRRVARAGGGPGELGVLWWVGRSADSLLTYDFSQSRITIFDVPNQRVETTPFVASGAPTRMMVIGALDGTNWLVSTAPRPFPREHPNGPYRDTTTVGIWNRSSGNVTLAGSFPNFALFAHNGPQGSSFAFDLMSANTSFVAVGGDIWIGIPDDPQILVINRAGRSVTRVRVPLSAYAIDNAALTRARNRHLAVMKDAEDSARTTAMFAIDRLEGARTLFSRMFAGTDGHVWLEAFRVSRTDATEYVALDRQGRIRGRLHGPPAVRFLDIGEDYALGVHRDVDDVESVVQYQIRK